MLEVFRTGHTVLMYKAEACAAGDGVVVGESSYSTGFADLDVIVRGEVAKVALPPGECVKVTLLTSRFECH